MDYQNEQNLEREYIGRETEVEMENLDGEKFVTEWEYPGAYSFEFNKEQIVFMNESFRRNH